MRRWWAATGFMLLIMPGVSSAVDLEELVSPGPLIEAHAEAETDCKSCHSPFKRSSEVSLCLECHEKVAADIETKAGFHGRQPDASKQICRTCHSEHKGPKADITTFDPETFDHRLTDYALIGAHTRTECSQCHTDGQAFRDAPVDCFACHAEDDSHAGRLGDDCSACHSETRWSEARFDHDQTEFPLDGSHQEVECALCHPAQKFEATVQTCVGCHSVNDVHMGSFGQQCGDCHGTMAWKRGGFDHDLKTKFPLRGKHRTASCGDCHKSGVPASGQSRSNAASRTAFDTKLDTSCISCHRLDDGHRGDYGTDCGQCHGALNWQRVVFDHQKKTDFSLDGAHRALACGTCHRGRIADEDLSLDCHGCHGADDVHRGQEGEDCGSCHDAASWAGRVKFDHELTKFPLLGLHGRVPCEECHETMAFKDTDSACSVCHAENDVHDKSLGSDCEQCHNPNGWEVWRFDHSSQTRFALHGAHRNLDCRGCHNSPARGGAKRATSCESCHSMQDPHRGSFGSRCDDCHVDTDWKKVEIGR